MSSIATQLIHWHVLHGRHNLPWQGTRDPYAIWLSEIMLQQTQVATVIPYYERFMQKFPSVHSLAEAPLDAVLALWSGLGYYSRARNLHLAARKIVHDHQGQFPSTRTEIERLPGIGRSTAAAVAVFAFGRREAILDGNVKRVFARYFGISGFPGETKILHLLWEKAVAVLPADCGLGKIEAYTQALMDLGSTVCTRHTPQCHVCPLQRQCSAWQQQSVDQLPTPKPRKPLPQKETIMLLLMQQQKLLLQKRASTGIWGSLWCPPEIETGADATDYCRTNFGLNVQPPIELPALNHQFTHFKLCIRPQLLHVVSDPIIPHSQFVWMSPGDALSQGIPAPVRKLLQQNFPGERVAHHSQSSHHG